MSIGFFIFSAVPLLLFNKKYPAMCFDAVNFLSTIADALSNFKKFDASRYAINFFVVFSVKRHFSESTDRYLTKKVYQVFSQTYGKILLFFARPNKVKTR